MISWTSTGRSSPSASSSTSRSARPVMCISWTRTTRSTGRSWWPEWALRMRTSRRRCSCGRRRRCSQSSNIWAATSATRSLSRTPGWSPICVSRSRRCARISVRLSSKSRMRRCEISVTTVHTRCMARIFRRSLWTVWKESCTPSFPTDSRLCISSRRSSCGSRMRTDIWSVPEDRSVHPLSQRCPVSRRLIRFRHIICARTANIMILIRRR